MSITQPQPTIVDAPDLRANPADAPAELAQGRRSWLRRNRSLAVSLALLIAFVGLAFWSQVRAVRGAMPYPTFLDEQYLTRIPVRILETGDLNPHFFIYPALPIYLNTLTSAAGYLAAEMRGELASVAQIGSASYPFYTHPLVIWPAKLAFILLLIAAGVFMGVVAYRLTGAPLLLVLVPFILSLSTLYYKQSTYLNVDGYGMFFVAALYLHLFLTRQDERLVHRAVWPGILTGMAVASKYQLVWVIVPAILTILFYAQTRRWTKLVLLGFVAGLSFLVCSPYTLLDLPGFIKDMTWSLNHYRSGHIGFESTPGLGQFLYLTGEMVRDFGYPLAVAALVGFGALLRQRLRDTVILLSFPMCLLGQMSTFKVNFIRNTLAIYPVYVLFIGVGLVVLYRLAAWALGRLRLGSAPVRQGIALAVLFAALWFLAPVERTLAWAQQQPDARRLAVAWIRAHVEQGATVVVPKELAMDVRGLRKNYRLLTLSLKDNPEAYRDIPVDGRIYLLMPQFGYDTRFPEAQALAEQLNQQSEYITALQAWSGNEVLVDYSQPVPSGNPGLAIGVWQPPQVAPLVVSEAVDLAPNRFYGTKRVEADSAVCLLKNGRLISDPLSLDPGRYEVLLNTRGTPAKGEYALLRVALGDRPIGEFRAAQDDTDTVLSFAVEQEQEGALVIEFVNDGATRNASGKVIEDRDAYIRAVAIRRVY